MRSVWFFLIFFLVTFIAGTVGYILSQDYMMNLIKEDGPVENLNAIMFLIASFSGLYYYFKSYANNKILLFLSILSLVGFLDELSFGARIFGISPPLIFGASLDAVHDIFYLAVKVIYHLTIAYPTLMISLFIVFSAIAAFILYKYRFTIKQLVTDLYADKPSFLLALSFAAVLGVAIIIDLDQIQHNYLYLTEELFELNAASALLFWILSLNRDQPAEVPGEASS